MSWSVSGSLPETPGSGVGVARRLQIMSFVSVVIVCRHIGEPPGFAKMVPTEREIVFCRVPSKTLASALQQGHALPTAALPHASPGKVNPSAHLQQNDTMRRFSDSGVRADCSR